MSDAGAGRGGIPWMAIILVGILAVAGLSLAFIEVDCPACARLPLTISSLHCPTCKDASRVSLIKWIRIRIALMAVEPILSPRPFPRGSLA